MGGGRALFAASGDSIGPDTASFRYFHRYPPIISHEDLHYLYSISSGRLPAARYVMNAVAGVRRSRTTAASCCSTYIAERRHPFSLRCRKSYRHPTASGCWLHTRCDDKPVRFDEQRSSDTDWLTTAGFSESRNRFGRFRPFAYASVVNGSSILHI